MLGSSWVAAQLAAFQEELTPWVSEWEVRPGPLGTAATTGLLYQTKMIDNGDYGLIGGMQIGRGYEVLGDNLHSCHFVHHKSYMTWPRFELGPQRWEPGYGIAFHHYYYDNTISWREQNVSMLTLLAGISLAAYSLDGNYVSYSNFSENSFLFQRIARWRK
jgi:hypothetical protein